MLVAGTLLCFLPSLPLFPSLIWTYIDCILMCEPPAVATHSPRRTWINMFCCTKDFPPKYVDEEWFRKPYKSISNGRTTCRKGESKTAMLTSALSSLYLCQSYARSSLCTLFLGGTWLQSWTIGCFYTKLAGLAASARVRGLNMWSVYTLNSVSDCLSPQMAASCCLPEVYVKPQNKKISFLHLSSSAFACASLHHCNLSVFYS